MVRPLCRFPDNYISIIFGNPGAGKTLFSVEQSLISANYFEKPIVANISYDLEACYQYAKKHRLTWLAKNLYFSRYPIFTFKYDLSDLLLADQSILNIDEFGINMFSRDTRANGRKHQLERLFKIRHYGNHIIGTAQRYKQIDMQLRELINLAIQVQGFSPWDKVNKRGRLLFRQLFYFRNEDYAIFDSRPKKFFWKYWVTRGENWLQFNRPEWSDLFNCYKSFNPLELLQNEQKKPKRKPYFYYRDSDNICLLPDSYLEPKSVNSIDYSIWEIPEFDSSS